MKAGLRSCQRQGCRRGVKKSVEGRRIEAFVLDTGPGTVNVKPAEWRFQLCAEDERRVYEFCVGLVTNGLLTA